MEATPLLDIEFQVQELKITKRLQLLVKSSLLIELKVGLFIWEVMITLLISGIRGQAILWVQA